MKFIFYRSSLLVMYIWFKTIHLKGIKKGIFEKRNANDSLRYKMLHFELDGGWNKQM